MAATAWHTVRCERRYHVNNLHYLCLPSASNIFVNSVVSLFDGDLRTKIFHGFSKTSTSFFTVRFRICSRCTSESPLCLHREFMQSSLLLLKYVLVINYFVVWWVCSECTVQHKSESERWQQYNVIFIYNLTILVGWSWIVLSGFAFCVWFKISCTEYYRIPDTGNTQKEIAVFRGPFFAGRGLGSHSTPCTETTHSQI
jgi:hypothetical protein